MICETDIVCENCILRGKVTNFYTTYDISKVLSVSISSDGVNYVETDEFEVVDGMLWYKGSFSDGDRLRIKYIGLYEV